jgi:hypothetical protein
MERLSIKKLIIWKVKEQYKISNTCAAFVNFDDVSFGKIIENTEVSVKEILFNYKLRGRKSRLMMNVQNYFIKGNRLNCNCHRIPN